MSIRSTSQTWVMGVAENITNMQVITGAARLIGRVHGLSVPGLCTTSVDPAVSGCITWSAGPGRVSQSTADHRRSADRPPQTPGSDQYRPCQEFGQERRVAPPAGHAPPPPASYPYRFREKHRLLSPSNTPSFLQSSTLMVRTTTPPPHTSAGPTA